MRRLVSRPFAPKNVNEYEEAVRTLAIEVLDSLERTATSSTSSNASPGSYRCACWADFLGLPDDDLDWLVLRGDALIGNTDPDFTDYVVDQVDTSDYRLLPFRSPVALELFEYASQALEERRITPTHDVLSALLEPTADGDTLDDLALKNFFTLMVAAGNDTTRYTMTGGLLALIERPELFERVPDMSLEERKGLVEEMLRWTTVTMHFRSTLTTRTRSFAERPLARATKWCSGTRRPTMTRTTSPFPRSSIRLARRTTTWPSAYTARISVWGHISRDSKFVCYSKRWPRGGVTWNWCPSPNSSVPTSLAA